MDKQNAAGIAVQPPPRREVIEREALARVGAGVLHLQLGVQLFQRRQLCRVGGGAPQGVAAQVEFEKAKT
jgi:hypothetical protein